MMRLLRPYLVRLNCQQNIQMETPKSDKTPPTISSIFAHRIVSMQIKRRTFPRFLHRSFALHPNHSQGFGSEKATAVLGKC